MIHLTDEIHELEQMVIVKHPHFGSTDELGLGEALWVRRPRNEAILLARTDCNEFMCFDLA